MNMVLFVCFAHAASAGFNHQPTRPDVDRSLLIDLEGTGNDNEKRRVQAVEKLWKYFPPAKKRGEFSHSLQIVSQILKYIDLQISTNDELKGYESLVSGQNGYPIYAMIVHVGQPAVPEILDYLRDLPLTNANDHKVSLLLSCLYQAYEFGGEGRVIAKERIRLYASKLTGDKKDKMLKFCQNVILNQ